MGVPNTEYILKAEPAGFPGYKMREPDWHTSPYIMVKSQRWKRLEKKRTIA